MFWSMVDWDRVEQLRSKGWDWDRIAADPKVGFHPEASVRDEGRALRALYHRHRSKEGRRESEPTRPTRKDEAAHERRWTLPRVGYLLVPIFGLWALLAYLAPSPVGVLIPAFPYLLIALAGAAFVLFFGLFRTQEKRWTPLFRTTLIVGIILGLVVAGVVGISSYVLGCPYLPPSLASEPAGWSKASVSPWQEGGSPVFYFYGATWCPYCSASSWAMWKALTEFQTGFNGGTNGIPGTSFYYSNPGDVYPSTPEVVLGLASVSSPAVAFQVSEYLWTLSSGVAGTFPGTSNCIQQAYVSAYSGGSIPFVVINGQYIHAGATIIDPNDLSTWADSANGGYGAVASSVLEESGTPWSVVQSQAAWITAFVVKSDGFSTVAAFLTANPGLKNPANYQWTSSMQSLVNTDLGQIS